MPGFRYSPAPSYRHHRASGQAVVTLCGRDFYLGRFGSKASQLQYDRTISLWLNAGRTLAFLRDAKADLTVTQVCAAFWQHAKTHYVHSDGSPTQELANYKRVIAPLRELFGRTLVTEFGPIKLKVVRDRLVADGLARETINHHVSRIRNLFRWGVANELVPSEIHQALCAVAGLQRGRTSVKESTPVSPVADDVLDKTMACLPAVVADMVQLQRLTGMRPAEVCSLRPSNVSREGEVWTYRPDQHKTQHRGKERTIFLGPRAQAILGKYLLGTADACCFSPVKSTSQRRAVRSAQRTTAPGQGNSAGTNRTAHPKKSPTARYTTDSYRRAIWYACEQAFAMPERLRYPHRQQVSSDELSSLRQEATAWRQRFCWSPNQIRHTTATAIRKGFGLEAAQTVLGHSSADITQIYAERDYQMAAAIMKQVG